MNSDFGLIDDSIIFDTDTEMNEKEYSILSEEEYIPTNKEEIEEMVFAFQKNETEQGISIINSFDVYLGKWISFLRGAPIRFDHHDLNKFMSFFFSGQTRHCLIWTKKEQPKINLKIAYWTMVKCRYALSHITDQQLKEEMQIILLGMAKRYTKKKPSYYFVNVVVYFFSVYLKDYVFKLIKEKYQKEQINVILSLDTFKDIELDSEEELKMQDAPDRRDYMPDNPRKKYCLTDSQNTNEPELDLDWIYGISASEVFVSLSPLERLILKMLYVDKIKVKAIAEKLGYTQCAIKDKKKRAIELLQQNMKECLLLKED